MRCWPIPVILDSVLTLLICCSTGVGGFSYDVLTEVLKAVGQKYGKTIVPSVYYFDWCEKAEGCDGENHFPC